ncbi:ABC transporter permease [Amycolatopsis rhabdoformis]|uniref:ABC transporter permease n=1 Tax=Amycolatopsis rhabdoformis TaxID=1448059 RepID=A0ABZ1IM56_9PSEU|nr:ABC transporter permease [Amycolatopsis rhabdoformis]WSE34763.1 ABC transporter permease [Amycolatopsis rhabdoformis]
MSRYAVLVVLIALVVFFCVLMPRTFATGGNFRVMASSQTVVLILAIGATVVLRTGEFDLSLGNLMAFSGVLLGVLYDHGFSAVAAISVVAATGLLVGFVNGFLVVRIGVSSLVATLGMLSVLAGATFALTGGRRADTYPPGLATFTNKTLFGLPLMTFYGWLAVLAAWYVCERTALGRRLLFIGGNKDAARLAGVRVDRIRIGSFVAASALATFAGIVISGSLGSVDPGIGASYLLAPFAAAFLGATAITPGRYNSLGTLAGLYLLTVGITGLQLLGGALWIPDVFNGAALLFAVTLGLLAGRRRG